MSFMSFAGSELQIRDLAIGFAIDGLTTELLFS
jgi:hypothetical protein